MAGLDDEDEFRDAEDGAGTAPPPSSSQISTPSKSKPDTAAGGFGRRLLASIGLPTSFSAAIGRSVAPYSPKPLAPQPPAGPNLGLGLLLHQGSNPSADGSLVPDASARNVHLHPTAGFQKQHEEVPLEQGAPEDGEDQAIGHDVGVGEELSVPVLTEKEGQQKQDVGYGCSGIRNGDLDKEGEQHESDESGAAMEDQEVTQQEGPTMYYTVVEDQSNNNAVQWAGDAPTAIKGDSAVEEKEAMEQGCVVGILGVSGDSVAGGLQVDEDGLVEGQCEDGISVQDQHKVVEQCRNDDLGDTMADSQVHDLEEVVVGQEGLIEHFDAAVEDHSNKAALEQHPCDELGVIKDDNVVEDKEEALEQKGAIGILDAAEDDIPVRLQNEDVVVEDLGEDAISAKDQDKVVEQCISDELGVHIGDSAVYDQAAAAVEQEGVADHLDTAVEDQIDYTSLEQSTSDELRVIKDDDVVVDKEKAVEQRVAIDILGTTEDGLDVVLREEDVVVEGQREYGISVQDQDNIVEQATRDELGVAMGESTIHDQEAAEGHNEDVISIQFQYKVVEQCTSDDLEVAMVDSNIQDHEVEVEQEGITEYVALEDHSNNASVMQCTSDELSGVKDVNIVEIKEKALEQEVEFVIQGAAENSIAVGLQGEDNMVVEGQGGGAFSVQDQHKVVDQCITDDLGVAMGDSVVQDQEVAALYLEGVTGCFDAALEDQSNKCAVEQCTSDELETNKDGNFVEEKEKAVVEEHAIYILDPAKDDVNVGSQEEGEVVISEQDEVAVSLQDKYKAVEQFISDQVRTTDVNAAHEQEVVEQGANFVMVAIVDEIVMDAQEKAVVQSAGDESRANKATEDKEKAVEQFISDQVRTAEVNAAHEQEVVEQEGASFVRVATVDDIVMDAQEKAVEQSAGDESRATKVAEDKEKVVDKGLMDKQGAIKGGSALESQEDEGVSVNEECGNAIPVHDQDKEVEQCPSDRRGTTMDNNAAEHQELRREKIRFCVGYPQRPGRPNCRVYMSTGSCAYGLSCCLNHPQVSSLQLKAKPEVPSFPSEQGSLEVAQILELNRVGLPIRENARNCTYYMRNGNCRYGKRCCFNHPEHVLDVQLYKPTGWDDTNLPSSPQSKKSSPHLKESYEHATLDDKYSSDILPANILQMLLPPQTVPPGAEAKETKMKKDPGWSSASDDSDVCCLADSSGWPFCKQENHVDYPERSDRQECPYLLKYGNCKFASSCQYYHPNDRFARRYHMKDPSLSEQMVYPDKPGAPECPFYMKTGACKFGTECKFHHPKDLLPSTHGPTIPKRPVYAKELHPETKTTLQYHVDQQQNYPERPGQPECRYYMQFGKCKFLSACIFHHPKDRVLGMPECPFYMKTGTCQFGSACEFYHPKQRCSSKGVEITDGTEYGHDYPERPGVNECSRYMKHGYCKFQMNCKYHHPTDRLSRK